MTCPDDRDPSAELTYGVSGEIDDVSRFGAAELNRESKGVCLMPFEHPMVRGGFKRAIAAEQPRFTSEETIMIRNIATGSSVKEIAGRLRLPREILHRLMGNLRRKTGAADDTALAVWVLRNLGSRERRGAER
jgi:DNA-binding NarL/FixJ family response regulator